MRPLQIWLPRIQGGLAHPARRRDGQRAVRAWAGENVIWVGPIYRETTHWRQDQARCAAINGEEWEELHVLHCDDRGTVYGPGAARFPNLSVSGLLDSWLNLSEVSIQLVPALEEVSLRVPIRDGNQMVAGTFTLPSTLGSYVPILRTDENSQTARLQWPPDQSDPQPVSPEAESAERYGLPTDMDGISQESAARSSSGPLSNSIPCRIGWPEPFDHLFPLISSLDELYARDLMRDIATQSQEDAEAAIGRALTESREWISMRQSNLANTWLYPILAREGEAGALSALFTRYDVGADSLEEAYDNPNCQEILRRPVQVREVWGVVGLMWELLIDRLESGLSFRNCQRCGRMITGRSNRQFWAVSEQISLRRAT